MGVIGGADGPTAVFISADPAGIVLLTILAAALTPAMWGAVGVVLLLCALAFSV